MPLVVPGINNTGGSKDEWLNKLVGKKISESSDATVRCSHLDIIHLYSFSGISY